MIGYITLGTNDPARAQAFFDALLGTLGVTRLMELDSFVLWGKSMDEPCLASTKPYNQEAATYGNGTMVALQVESPEQVQAVYDTALANGGSDEGAPGPRGDDGFYAAYFRDPDGNKLNAFCMTAPPAS